jgi:hypothetical protein
LGHLLPPSALPLPKTDFFTNGSSLMDFSALLMCQRHYKLQEVDHYSTFPSKKVFLFLQNNSKNRLLFITLGNTALKRTQMPKNRVGRREKKFSNYSEESRKSLKRLETINRTNLETK